MNNPRQTLLKMWATLKQTNLLLGRYFTTDSLEKLIFSSFVQQKIVKNNKAQRKYTTISVHCPKKALRGTNVLVLYTEKRAKRNYFTVLNIVHCTLYKTELRGTNVQVQNFVQHKI